MGEPVTREEYVLVERRRHLALERLYLAARRLVDGVPHAIRWVETAVREVRRTDGGGRR